MQVLAFCVLSYVSLTYALDVITDGEAAAAAATATLTATPTTVTVGSEITFTCTTTVTDPTAYMLVKDGDFAQVYMMTKKERKQQKSSHTWLVSADANSAGVYNCSVSPKSSSTPDVISESVYITVNEEPEEVCQDESSGKIIKKKWGDKLVTCEDFLEKFGDQYCAEGHASNLETRCCSTCEGRKQKYADLPSNCWGPLDAVTKKACAEAYQQNMMWLNGQTKGQK